MLMEKTTKMDMEIVKNFVSPLQFKTMKSCLNGEEGEFFSAKFEEYAERIKKMPQTYEQDGLGEDAIVYLHYFLGGYDFYITEKDMEKEQHQAFGLAILNNDLSNSELGYISIIEITNSGLELDLHFEPQTIRKIKAEFKN